jgi:hypothetical protein
MPRVVQRQDLTFDLVECILSAEAHVDSCLNGWRANNGSNVGRRRKVEETTSMGVVQSCPTLL